MFQQHNSRAPDEAFVVVIVCQFSRAYANPFEFIEQKKTPGKKKNRLPSL